MAQQVTLIVGMQLGNNYRVVASVVDQSLITGVQVTTSTAGKYLGPALTQNAGAPASPLLTVWRRLWVENDSMAAIPVDSFGYKRTDLSSDLAHRIYSQTLAMEPILPFPFLRSQIKAVLELSIMDGSYYKMPNTS